MTRTNSTKPTKSSENTENADTPKGNLADAILNTLKSEQFMQNLSILISDAVNTQIKSIFEEQKVVIKSLEQKYENLTSEYAKLKSRAEKAELYSRRNNLRIFGIPEKQRENTNNLVWEIIHNNMKLTNIRMEDIEKIHRIGVSKSAGKPRAILVSFVNHSIREAVYKHKSKLRGTKIIIQEDLPVERLEIYKKACEEFNYKNVWSSNGTIFIKYENKITKLHTQEQFVEEIEKKKNREHRNLVQNIEQT